MSADYHASKADAVKPARMARALADFARNGRWGTCASCPLDGDGRKVPELCEHTGRYDHLLTIDALAFQIHRDERKPRGGQ